MLSDETREAIEQRALEITREIESKLGPYHAEIKPDVPASWHLVRTHPSKEYKAGAFLAQRGFGIYLPVKRAWRASRGRKRQSDQLLFPGYAFLLVWDVKAHWRRIISCPGVSTVVCRDEVPLIVPPQAIYELQQLEIRQDERMREQLAYRPEETAGASASKKKGKKWRRVRKSAEEAAADAKIAEQPDFSVVISRPRSFWNVEALAAVDSTTRIAALHQALGLADSA